MRFSKKTGNVSDLVCRIQVISQFVGEINHGREVGQMAVVRQTNLVSDEVSTVEVGDLQRQSGNEKAAMSAASANKAVGILSSPDHMSVRVVLAAGSSIKTPTIRKNGWLEVWSRSGSFEWEVYHFEEMDGLGYWAMSKIARDAEQVELLLHLASNGSLREYTR